MQQVNKARHSGEFTQGEFDDIMVSLEVACKRAQALFTAD